MRRALVHVTSVRCRLGQPDKAKTSCNVSRTLPLTGAKSSCSAPIWGFVCVCTVLDHERRGSLPITCSCNFTCQFTCQFTAGECGTCILPHSTKLSVDACGKRDLISLVYLQTTWSAWALSRAACGHDQSRALFLFPKQSFQIYTQRAISTCVADMWHAIRASVVTNPRPVEPTGPCRVIHLGWPQSRDFHHFNFDLKEIEL